MVYQHNIISDDQKVKLMRNIYFLYILFMTINSAQSAYEISSFEDLKKIGTLLPRTGDYIQTKDIYTSQTLFTPIPSFAGTYNGQDYNIYDLRLYRREIAGLFYVIENEGVVKNIGLVNCDALNGITGKNFGIINNCYTSGTISQNSGLVGENYGNIINSYSYSYVTGGSSVGGLVGTNIGEIYNCYSRSTVIGDSYNGSIAQQVGGLVGFNTGVIANCYSISTVEGEYNIGGLVGKNEGYILFSYCSGSNLFQEKGGGLVGGDYS